MSLNMLNYLFMQMIPSCTTLLKPRGIWKRNYNINLSSVCVWLNENKLTLNIKKTKFMIIGSTRKLSNIDSETQLGVDH